jgi:transcriptional regulator with XRE-family HTH domain
MNDLAAFIKKVRREKNLSQEKVADKAQLARSYISKLEDGKILTPSAMVLVKLSKGLDVSQETIFQEAGYVPQDDHSKLPPLDVYLRTKYPKLSTQAIKDIEFFKHVIEEKYKK